MKLFYFNPNDWGYEYFVMAENPETAIKEVVKFLKKELTKQKTIYKDMDFSHDEKYIEKWEQSTLDNLPDNYKLEVYGPNQVIESELS